MNFVLLDEIDRVARGVLVTVAATEGHTYKKRGAKALFEIGDAVPVYGNLGSLCVDQEILNQATDAYARRQPGVITIDTRDPEDVHFGYGAFCGGVQELVIEPILSAHKAVYRSVRERLEAHHTVTLVHNLENGELRIDEGLDQSVSMFTERLTPPTPLLLFGATPLARVVTMLLYEMPVRVHIYDWRREHLKGFKEVVHVEVHEDAMQLDERWLVLIMSHSYERDMEVLYEALSKRCPYVGLLSSSKRRDAMYEALLKRGVSRQALDQVHSPVGLDLGGRSDVEIA
ncbi:MAG: XdhC family protein, partial [Candidatus Latescibacterota bacterium]